MKETDLREGLEWNEGAPGIWGPGQGERVEIDGVRIRILVDGSITGGAWSLVEYTAPPYYRGAACRRHFQAQDTYYILSGTLTFLLLDTAPDGVKTVAPQPRERVMPPGSCLVMPGGREHALFNADPVPVTFLIWFTPAGMEGYLRELARLGQ